MIALLLLVCWLVVSVYVPFLLWLTREPPSEVRRVTNALVRQRAAQIVSADRVTLIYGTCATAYTDELADRTPVP